MTKKFIATLTVTGLMISLAPVLAAKPDFQAVEVTKASKPVTVTIPANAVEVAPGIFSLGTSVDPSGQVLEGYAIIHYKRGYGHKPNHKPGGGGKPGGETTSTCFAPLAKGASWKNVEPFRLDATNSVGLATSTVRTLVTDGLEKWDTAAGVEIFGDEEGGVVDGGSIGNSANGNNEVVFGSIDSPGAIAVTYVWGIFSGKPSNRLLGEWDMIYDQDDFTWNTDGNANDMDFDNIFTHESGHAAGLGHPSDTCVDETMYRFAGEGETKKRDLNAGDIAGVVDLYN